MKKETLVLITLCGCKKTIKYEHAPEEYYEPIIASNGIMQQRTFKWRNEKVNRAGKRIHTYKEILQQNVEKSSVECSHKYQNNKCVKCFRKEKVKRQRVDGKTTIRNETPMTFASIARASARAAGIQTAPTVAGSEVRSGWHFSLDDGTSGFTTAVDDGVSYTEGSDE